MQGVDGLISGLQTSALIESMIQTQRRSIAFTEFRRDTFQARAELVRSFNTRLLSAQLDTVSLRRQATYTGRGTTSSDDSVLVASASSSADVGSHDLTINQLAQAHQIATAGRASDTEDIGAGTVTIQLGNGAQKTLSFTSDASSLKDIAQAINDADVNITASVINDGDASNPHRLSLQSDKTGADNTISVSGTDNLQSLFDVANLTTLTSAQNAQLQLGSDGTLTVEKASNTVDDLIEGLTFTLKEAGTATITVGDDPEPAKKAIETFVGSLNKAISDLNEYTFYDGETGETGLLFSESGLKRGLDEVVARLFGNDANISDGLRSASSLGLEIDDETGKITIDEEVLDAKLAEDLAGVRKLFTNTAESSHANVRLGSLNKNTDVSGSFAVDITQVATRATAGSTAALAASTVIDSSNNGLSLSINDETFTFTLASGTYTRSELADHIETLINDEVGTGQRVDVGVDSNNELFIRSRLYGSSQTIQVDSTSTAVTSGALPLVTSQVTGQDVAGTIDGEAVTGIGQVLSGKTGSASEGLKLIVDADTTLSGVTLDVRKGLGQRLDEALKDLTDPEGGLVSGKEAAFESIAEDLDERVDRFDARMDVRRQRLEKRFAALESLLGQFQAQEQFLQSQLAGFANLARAIGNRSGNR